MTIQEPPRGKLFSEVYLERGEPSTDSERARLRVGAHFCALINEKWEFSQLIERRLGVTAPSAVAGDYFWKEFFKKIKVRDFLDIITLVWRFLDVKEDKNTEVWAPLIDKVFSDENLRYRVDEKGGVHFRVDVEFEFLRTSSISALVAPRYRAVRDAFENAQSALDKSPPDGKAAIRDTFEAAEILFRLMFPAVSRLGASEVNNHLKPYVRQRHDGNDAAREAANLFISAFANWVNGAHHYRHGQAVLEPTVPPMTFAVAMVSAGITYIRWLAELDSSEKNPSSA